MVIEVAVLISATFVTAVVTASLSVEVVSKITVSESVEDGAEVAIVDSEAVDKILEPTSNQYKKPIACRM